MMVRDKKQGIDTAVKALQAMNPMAVERLLAVVTEIVIRLLDRDEGYRSGSARRLNDHQR